MREPAKIAESHEDALSEVQRLRSLNRDLISLFVQPAIGTGQVPAGVIRTLVEVLLSMLRVDLAYVRVMSPGEASIEAACASAGPEIAQRPSEVGVALERWLRAETWNAPITIESPFDGGEMRLLVGRFGLHEDSGVVAVGSRRQSFPDETEALLFRVAVNQAVIGFREAQVLQEHQRGERLALEAASLGTWDYRPQSGDMTWSDRCKELFGLPPDANVDYQLFLVGLHPEDRERTHQAVQRALAAESGGSFKIEYRTVGLQDGIERWVSMAGRVFFERSGRAVRCIGTVRDITEPKRVEVERELLLAKEQAARAAAEEAKSRAAFLAEVGPVLSESLDYEETLKRLARLCVPAIADWCVVDVVVDGREIQRLGAAYFDPAKEPMLLELQRRYPPRWDSPHPSARILRTGEPLLLPQLSDDDIRSLCEDDEHARLIREMGTRSVVAVPLVARGQTLGVISLASAAPGRRYGTADLELARELAHRAAIAIDNARLYREAREAIRLRDEFLSVASHELYTPITSLMLSVEALLPSMRAGEALDPRAASRLLDLVVRQGRRLIRLVGDLLDVSRIETGRLRLDVADVELGALVREVVERLEVDLARTRCTLSIGASGPVNGRWDRSRLDQVVTNLLSNAMKFAAGKPIEISICAERGVARLAVRDTGIGVNEERQERIFDRFERAASVEHYGGLGLGLYISRRIVEAHGGTIRVESEPGAGSTFTVELPCAGPPQATGRGRWREG
jgi:PAS domain S-box-containing protein